MKFYEEMPTEERELMLLRTVLLDVSLEDMEAGEEYCREEITTLQQKVDATLKGSESPKNP